MNLTKHDNKDKAKKIIKDEGLESLSYYDVNDDLNQNYDIIGVPASFYIDEDGIIKKITFGADVASGILEKINE